ncbi:MAG: hypothetical protein ACXVAC_16210 [Vulcanimicrobiaceae bacterium]
MSMKGSLAVYAALALSMIAPAPAASNPIVIDQCFVTVPKPMSKLASGTQIVYVNRGRKTASQVTFTVSYRNSASHFIRRVTDTGDFAPGTQINHHFNLYNDVTYGGKTVQSCSATHVRWSDGTSWSI